MPALLGDTFRTPYAALVGEPFRLRECPIDIVGRMTLLSPIEPLPDPGSLMGTPGGLHARQGQALGCGLQHSASDAYDSYLSGSVGANGSPLGGLYKRALDVVIASIMLVAAAPLLLAIAVLIRVTVGGPVLFRHRRIGFGGQQFSCLKFRTMVLNADEILHVYLHSNAEAALEWATCQKLKRDPRTTFLGEMLRKSSLDELPQLLNILRGEMSCVGPRPITVDELKRYGSVADAYLKARPGLTGLWQVNGRNKVDYSRRISLDAQYLSRWSMWSDLVILVWTIGAIVQFDRAS